VANLSFSFSTFWMPDKWILGPTVKVKLERLDFPQAT